VVDIGTVVDVVVEVDVEVVVVLGAVLVVVEAAGAVVVGALDVVDEAKGEEELPQAASTPAPTMRDREASTDRCPPIRTNVHGGPRFRRRSGSSRSDSGRPNAGGSGGGTEGRSHTNSGVRRDT
jgi:hypothetical protein